MGRSFWLGAAAAAALAAPATVADATTDRMIAELVTNPPVCLPGTDVPLDARQDDLSDMIMVDGFGTGGFAIATTNPEAQRWFDHGVRLRWAFEHSESVRAFRKARALDPDCAMCAWGEAWAMGPNLNGGGGGEEVAKAALKIARDARRMGRRETAVNRQLMDALVQRYSGREDSRDNRFAQATERLADNNPNAIGLQSIAADALLMTTWDWWDEDGKAKTREISKAVEVLERTLALSPDDPGAIHLYIHLTEWSDDPHRAIPYGEKLALLAPGASHLVHMPSHTFYRVGRYREAMMSNVNAVALDKAYDQKARPPGGVPAMPLHGHNIHFGMGGALMSGGREEGLKLADWFFEVFADIAPDNTWRQVMTANAYALYGRYGTAEEVAALPDPGETRPLQRLFWHYAKGELAARQADPDAILAEAKAIGDLAEIITAEGGDDMAPQEKAIIAIPRLVLEGRAAMADGDWAKAQTAFREAAELQESVDLGGDPPAWWYPIRRSLAAALALGGDPAAAKAEIETFTAKWPDPSAFFVLAAAERALGNAEAAEAATAKSNVEWIGPRRTLAFL